jgi:hypothetical protein
MAHKQCPECKVSKHTSEFCGSVCKSCRKRGKLLPAMAYYARPYYTNSTPAGPGSSTPTQNYTSTNAQNINTSPQQ